MLAQQAAMRGAAIATRVLAGGAGGVAVQSVLRRALHATDRAPMTVKSEHISPLYQFGGVHGSRREGGKSWRNKPLFRREGDARFKTGSEATEMLIQEAKRKDPHAMQFLDTLDEIIPTLAPLLDRAPKYAWIAKQLLEPERVVQFRVSWLDDNGNSRINRGWRVQYSSSLGPYEGGLNFSGSITSGVVKALGLESVFINSLTGCNLGAAAGGADFNPHNKSEAEIQRFCQSYMTELSKYIGPDHDYPSMGFGVGINEIGYLYGQWKRMNSHLAQRGSGILWGGLNPYPQAVGHGIVHFAEAMLNGKKESLKGKRCLVTGSGKVALHVAEKLLEYGAIPLSFTDQSGHIYEPEGFDEAKLKTLIKIKSERGARVGRYIIASTTAKYQEPANLFSVPCDLVFPCAQRHEIDDNSASILADNGCMGVIEGANSPCTKGAKYIFRNRGMLLGPYKATLSGGGVANGSRGILQENVDPILKGRMFDLYEEVKETAQEFNMRGNLDAGATIRGFVTVADVMLAHGSV